MRNDGHFNDNFCKKMILLKLVMEIGEREIAKMGCICFCFRLTILVKTSAKNFAR